MTTLTQKRIARNYTLGRMVNTIDETVIMVTVKTSQFDFQTIVRDLFNASKSVDFKKECDAIRKSKSMKKKEIFINANIETWVEMMNKEGFSI